MARRVHDLGARSRRACVVAELLGRPAGTLLDVGCGTGAHASALGPLGWTVTGVDVADDALRLARGRGLDVVPCFVGPHARCVAADGARALGDGYPEAGRDDGAPATGPDGLRPRVGGAHLPLATFAAAFLDAGLVLERLVGPRGRGCPHEPALRWRR